MPKITLKPVETIMKVQLGEAALADVYVMEKARVKGTNHVYSPTSLFTKLNAVNGVDNVDYYSLLDPVVYFSLEARLDNKTKRARIARLIEEHVAEARRHVKEAAKAAKRKKGKK